MSDAPDRREGGRRPHDARQQRDGTGALAPQARARERGRGCRVLDRDAAPGRGAEQRALAQTQQSRLVAAPVEPRGQIEQALLGPPSWAVGLR